MAGRVAPLTVLVMSAVLAMDAPLLRYMVAYEEGADVIFPARVIKPQSVPLVPPLNVMYAVPMSSVFVRSPNCMVLAAPFASLLMASMTVWIGWFAVPNAEPSLVAVNVVPLPVMM